jgi:hypothetical protein
MAYMTDTEAKETIESMRDTAVWDAGNLKRRINGLKEDLEKDPWVDTAAQITRLETRLVVMNMQAAALAIAAEKFKKED